MKETSDRHVRIRRREITEKIARTSMRGIIEKIVRTSMRGIIERIVRISRREMQEGIVRAKSSGQIVMGTESRIAFAEDLGNIRYGFEYIKKLCTLSAKLRR